MNVKIGKKLTAFMLTLSMVLGIVPIPNGQQLIQEAMAQVSDKQAQNVNFVQADPSGYGGLWAIDENGGLWTYGYPSINDINRPNGQGFRVLQKAGYTQNSQSVEALPPVVKTSAGWETNIVLDVNGDAWINGDAISNARYYYLNKVPGLPKIVDIAASTYAAFFVGVDGKVYMHADSGYANNGGITAGMGTNSVTAGVKVIPNVSDVDIIAASEHRANTERSTMIAANTTTGKVYTWGYSGGTGNGGSATPKLAHTFEDGILDVKALDGSWAVLTKTGELYTWGFGSNGNLGHGNYDSISSPKKVEKIINNEEVPTFKAITGKYRALIATAEDGTHYATGQNGNESIGNTPSGNILRPYVYRHVKNINVNNTVATGAIVYGGTVFIGEDGNLYYDGAGGYSTSDYGKPITAYGATDYPFITSLVAEPDSSSKAYTSEGTNIKVNTKASATKVKYVVIYPNDTYTYTDGEKYYDKTFAELEEGPYGTHYMAGTNRTITMSPQYGTEGTKNYANPKITKSVFDSAYESFPESQKGDMSKLSGTSFELGSENLITNNAIVWIQSEGGGNTYRMIYTVDNIYEQAKAWVEATATVDHDKDLVLTLQEPEVVPGSYGLYLDQNGELIEGVPRLGYDLLQPAAPKYQYWMLSPDNQEKLQTSRDELGLLRREDETKEILYDSLDKIGDDGKKTPKVTFTYVKNPDEWIDVDLVYVDEEGRDFKVEIPGENDTVVEGVMESFKNFFPKGASDYKEGQDLYEPRKPVALGATAVGYIVGERPKADGSNADKIVRIELPKTWEKDFNPVLTDASADIYIVYKAGFVPFEETFIDITSSGSSDIDSGTAIKNGNNQESVTKMVQKDTGNYESTSPDINGYVRVGHQITYVDDAGVVIDEQDPVLYEWDSDKLEYVVPGILIERVPSAANVRFLYKLDDNANKIPDVEEGRIQVNWVGIDSSDREQSLHKTTLIGNALQKDTITIEEDKASNLAQPTRWIFRPGNEGDEEPYLPLGSAAKVEDVAYKLYSDNDENITQIYFYYDQDYNSNGVIDKNEGKVVVKYKVLDEESTEPHADLEPAVADRNYKYLEGYSFEEFIPIQNNYVAVGYQVDDNDVVKAERISYDNVTAKFTVAAEGNTITYLYQEDKNKNDIPDNVEARVIVRWYATTASGSNVLSNSEILYDFHGEDYDVMESLYTMQSGWLFYGSKVGSGDMSTEKNYTGKFDKDSVTYISFYYDEDSNENSTADKDEPIVINISGIVVDSNGDQIEDSEPLYSFSRNSGYSENPFEIDRITIPTYIIKDGSNFTPIVETSAGSKSAISSEHNRVVTIDPSLVDVNSEAGRTIDITFRYVDNMGIIQIENLYTDGTPVGGVYTVPGEIGKTVVVEVPELLEFTHKDSNPKDRTVTVAADGSSKVTFYWTKNEYNLEVQAIDKTTGAIIGRKYVDVANGEKFTATTANAPTVKDIPALSNYDSVEGEGEPYEQTYNGVDELDTVQYIYSRTLRDVEVMAYYVDVDNNNEKVQIGKNISRGKFGVGLSHTIAAPSTVDIPELTTYTNVSGAFQETLVKNEDGTLVIEFEYKIMEGSAYKVIAFYDENGNNKFDAGEEELLDYFIYGETDRVIGTKAPQIAGYKLTDDEVKEAKPGEGVIVYFAYAEDQSTISFTLKDSKGNTLDAGYTTSYKVPNGVPHTAHAPHVQGYYVEGSTSNNLGTITSDKNIEFTYVEIDKGLVQIVVKGVESATNKELYRYTLLRAKNSGDVKVNAFDISGYALKTPTETSKTVSVKEADHVISFEYETLDRLITITAVDENDEKITSFTDIIVPAIKGNAFTYNAPHIDGYVLNEGSTIKKIDTVDGNQTLTFKYKKVDGKVIATLKEDNTNGRIIKVEAYTLDSVEVGDTATISVPSLAGDYYTQASSSSKTVKYEGEPIHIEFYYTKDLRVVGVDSKAGTDTINTKTSIGSFRVGETTVVEAPHFDGIDVYKLVDSTPKTILVTNGTGRLPVVFNYKSLATTDLVINAITKDGSNTKILQTSSITGVEGDEIRVNAPFLRGYKLITNEPSNKKGTIAEVITFEYEKNVSTITIKPVDASGNAITVPSDVVTSYETPNGEEHTVYAPHIPGYVIVAGEPSKVVIPNVNGGKTVEFIYVPISEVVDQYTAVITVKGVDNSKPTGTPLYTFAITRPINSGDFEVNALTLNGYVINGEDKKTVTVEEDDLSVTFRYDTLATTVTIKAVDENGDEISAFGTLIQPAVRGSAFSYNAPFIKGYTVKAVSELTKTINSVDESNNELVFNYVKSTGNVTVLWVEGEETTGRIIGSKNYNINVDGTLTVNADDLSEQFYTLIDGTAKSYTLSYKDEPQEVMFHYDKELLAVNVVSYDITNSSNGSKLNTYAQDKQRIGEVSEFTAYPEGGKYLVGSTTKLALIGENGPQEVRFDYKSLGDDEIAIEAVTKSGTVILQSNVLKVEPGSKLVATAPTIVGYVLSNGEQEEKIVRAGRKVSFNYDENVVYVTIVAKEGDDEGATLRIPTGTTTRFKVPKDTDFTTYAPHIPGYILTGNRTQYDYKAINQNQISTYYYQTINDAAVQVKVKGTDFLTGKELYSFTQLYAKNSGDVTVNGFELNGYDVMGTLMRDIEVKTENIEVEFKYRGLERIITIKAVTMDGQTEVDVPNFTPILVEAQKGDAFSYNAPHVPGYNLVDTRVTQIINEVTDDATLTFTYEVAEGNVFVTHREDDKNGRVIRTTSFTLDEGETKEIPLADLTADSYSAISTAKSVTYQGKPIELEYYYEKALRDVNVVAVKDVYTDESDKVLSTKSVGKYRVGEVSSFTAQHVDGWALIDSSPKLALVEAGTGPQAVEFTYTTRANDQIVVIAKFGTEILQTNFIKGIEGSSVTVSAPVIKGYKLKVGEIAFKNATVPETVIFEYEENVSTISLSLVDKDGTDVPVTSDIVKSYKVPNGEPHTVYAPHIPGYVLIKGQVSKVEYTNIIANQSVKFVYVPISEVVDEYTATINVKGIVKDSSPEKVLYSFRYTMPNNSGNTTVESLSQEGYDLVGESTKDVTVGTEDIDVVFEYVSRDAIVTIYTWEGSEDGTDNVQIGTEFNVNVQLGDDFTYTPPYIPGYFTNDSAKSIKNISEKQNRIDFYYEKSEANLTLILKEGDATGAIIKSEPVTLSGTDVDKVITPPDLSSLYYTAIAGQSETVSYSSQAQEIEFYYNKDTKEVETIGYNLSVEPAEELFKTKKEYRLGEVATFYAEVHDNLEVIGANQREVLVIPDTVGQIFNYKSVSSTQIVVNARLVDENGVFIKPIQSNTIAGVKVGDSIDISPPQLVGYKLKDSTIEYKTATSGSTVTFDYVEDVKYVTIVAKEKNKDGQVLSTSTPYKVATNTEYLAHAPHVPGYVLVDVSKNSQYFDKVTGDSTAEFYYIHITEVVSDYTVNVTVKGMVQGTTTELYNYTYTEINDAGSKEIEALSQQGYKVVGYKIDDSTDLVAGSKATINVEQDDIVVVFEFVSLATEVTVNLVNGDLDSSDENYHLTTPFKVAAEIGSAFEYKAPFVDGFYTNTDKITIDKVTDGTEVDGEGKPIPDNRTITFVYYKAQGNVTAELYERPLGGDGSTDVLIGTRAFEVTASEGSKVIAAPSLADSYYKITDGTDAEITVNYSSTAQTIKFYYTKETKTINVVAYDVTDESNPKKLEDETVAIENVRLGEVTTFSAKAIDNMKIFGQIKRDVLVTSDLSEVRFDYKSTGAGEVNVLAVFGSDKNTVIKDVATLRVTEGTSIIVDRPTLIGYKPVAVDLDGDGVVDEAPDFLEVEAGNSAIFYYELDEIVVTITAKVGNKDGEDITDLIDAGQKTSHNVARTAPFTVYAPHIPGYLLVDGTARAHSYSTVLEDPKPEFYYESINDAAVRVRVSGIDTKTNKELYSYTNLYAKNTKGVKVEAFELSGYTIDGESSETFDVGTDDKSIVFNYNDMSRTITIKAAVDSADGEAVPNFTDIVAEAQIGDAFSYNAPHILGYNLKAGESVTQTIDEVKDNTELTFVYTKAVGNVVITLKENDTNGRVIKTMSDEVALGDSKTMEVPDLTSDFFTAVAGQTGIEVTNTGSTMNIEFYYSKDSRNVDLTATDVNDSSEIDSGKVEDQGTYRVGEVSSFTAKHLEGYKLVDATPKLVLITKGEGNQVVNFNYEKSSEDEVQIVATFEGNILQTNSVKGTADSKISVTAPVIKGYKLAEGEKSIVSATVPSTVEFKYVKDVSTITISTLYNETEIETTTDVVKSYEVANGEEHTVYAPHIPGYVLKEGQVGKVSIANVTAEQTVVFKYVPISEVVDQYSVTITVKGIDTARPTGTPLYSYTVTKPNNSGDFEIEALAQNGYVINGDDKTTVDVKESDLSVTFKYDSLATTVTIKAVDTDGNGIASYRDTVQPAVIGEAFSYNAPYIQGYNISDASKLTQSIDKVSTTNNTLTFVYEKSVGNVTVIWKEEDTNGRIIGSESVDVTVANSPLTVTAEDLTSLSYTIVSGGATSQAVSYKDEPQVVEFYYTKGTIEVNQVAYDITDGEDKIETVSQGQQRIGEAVTFTARPQEGMYLVGSTTKTVIIGANGPQEVRFDYKSLSEAQVVVEAVTDKGTKILQSNTLSVAEGSTMSVKAPSIVGYVLEDESETMTVKAGEKATFNYVENVTIVNIVAREKNATGKTLTIPTDVVTTFKVAKGTDFTAYAPHIPGYLLMTGTNGYEEFKAVSSDVPLVAEFYYETINDAAIQVKVTGIDTRTNKELYNYTKLFAKNTGEMEVEGFELTGYKLADENATYVQNVKVEEANLAVTFKYADLTKTITIKAEDENGNAVENYTNIIVSAKAGDDFSYNAPHIPGYNLKDGERVTQTITPVTKDEDLVFVYTKATGNVVITLKENDGNGRVIKTMSDEVALGTSKEIEIPSLEADNYTAISKENETVTNTGTTMYVEYYYAKDSRFVEVVALDANGDELEEGSYEPTEAYRVGEVSTFGAKHVAGYKLTDSTPKLVLITKGEGNQVVNFNYATTATDEVQIVATYEGEILQTSFIKGTTDSTVSVSAPVIKGYKLADNEPSFVTATVPEVVEFKYVKDVSTITIKPVLADGTEITTTPDVVTSYETPNGEEHTVYAPHIPGYVLVEGQVYYQNIENVSSDKTVTFKYAPISEVVDLYTATVLVRGIDKNTNETLYSYEFTRPNDSGDVDVAYLPQNGYKLVSDETQTVAVAKDDVVVTFEFISLATTVTILAIDENEVAIPEFTTIVQPATIDAPFSYSAPYIRGYNVDDNTLKSISSVQDDDRTITFKYKKAEGNVIILHKEDDANGRVIASTSGDVTVGGSKTFTPIDLTKDYYTAVAGQSTDVSYSEATTTIEFYYTKDTADVAIVTYDVTTSEELINTYAKVAYRVGEVSTFVAPNEAGMYVVGETNKLVLVGPTTSTVRFDYKSTSEGSVTVNAVLADTNELLNSTNMTVVAGTTVRVNAPAIVGYKLVAGELDTKSVLSGNTVEFKYEKNVVTVTLVAKESASGNAIAFTPDTQTTFEVAKGTNFTAYAPHIPGYILVGSGTSKFNNLEENSTAEFLYETINDAIVNVKVNGIDIDSGKILFSYTKAYARNTGKVEVDGFELSGYKVANDIYKKSVSVVEEDLEVNFDYQGLTRTITIKALDVNVVDMDGKNRTVPGYTDILVSAQLDQPFSYNAPHIPGYELVSKSSIGMINKVEGDTVIEFMYKKSDGNVLVILKEDNTDGRVIKVVSKIVPEGQQKFEPVDLTGDYYTSISTAKDVNVVKSENVLEIEFYYTKDTRDMIIHALDQNGDNIKPFELGSHRVGEVVKVVARHIDDYVLDGLATKMVSVQKATDGSSQIVNFNYRALEDNEVAVIAKSGDVILQSNVIKGKIGSKVSVNAPEIVGYKLANGESSLKSGTVSGTIVFEYVENIAKVTLEVVITDEAGNDVAIDVPAHVDLTYTVPKGESHTAYAPHIPGYSLVSNQKVNFATVTGDVTARFVYKVVEIEDIGFFINVKYIDKLADEADSRYILAEFSDFVTYDAEALDLVYTAIPFIGYTFVGDSETITIVNDGAVREVIFEYEKTAQVDVNVSLFKNNEDTPMQKLTYSDRFVGSLFNYHVNDLSALGLDFVNATLNGTQINDSNNTSVKFNVNDETTGNELAINYETGKRDVTINRFVESSTTGSAISVLTTTGSAISASLGDALKVDTVTVLIGEVYTVDVSDYFIHNGEAYVYVGGINSITVSADANNNEINLYYIKLSDLLASKEIIVNHFARTVGDRPVSWLIQSERIKSSEEDQYYTYNTTSRDVVNNIISQGYDLESTRDYYIDLLNASVNDRVVNIYYTPKTISYDIEYKFGDEVFETVTVDGAFIGTIVATPQLLTFPGYAIDEIVYANKYVLKSNEGRVVVTVKYKENTKKQILIRQFDVGERVDGEYEYFLIDEFAYPEEMLVGSEFTFNPFVDVASYVSFRKFNGNDEETNYQIINNKEQVILVSNVESENIINLYYRGPAKAPEVPNAYVTINFVNNDGNIMKTDTVVAGKVGERFEYTPNVTTYNYNNRAYTITNSSNTTHVIERLYGTNEINIYFVVVETDVPNRFIPEEPGDGDDPIIPEEVLIDVEFDEIALGSILSHGAYIFGYLDGTVKPNSEITRGEVAQILYNLYKIDNPGSTSINASLFSDINEGMWYAEAVNTLAGVGIISGYTDGTFKPNQPITREEYVTLLVRYSKVEIIGAHGFNDVSADGWATKYIATAYSNGFIEGYGDGSFRGKNNITRAESIVSTNRMLNRVIDSNSIDESIEIEVIFSDINESDWYYYEVIEASNGHLYEIVNGKEYWRNEATAEEAAQEDVDTLETAEEEVVEENSDEEITEVE